MKLNMEQKRIVELEPSGHMLVKGVAGSGKTTVSVKRIPYLMSHYCHEPEDKVLLVTFNKTLLNYIKYQYKKFEEDEQIEFEFLLNKDKEVQIQTIDSLMFKYFLAYQNRYQANYKFSDKAMEYQTLGQAIHQVAKSYPDLKMLSTKYGNFFLDEINWIKACYLTHVDQYQQIDRIGRMNGLSGTPQKLLKNSDIRSAIFELMHTYDNLLERQGYVDFKRMNILAYEEARQNPQETYKHIIIDESQDLTKVQLEFIKCIYEEKPYASIMFVADNTQSIYSHSWLGKGRPFTTIGFDMSGKSRMLTKNYRTTTQISAAAYNLIEADESIKNNVDFVQPSLIDRQGMPPIYKYFKDSQSQMAFLVEEIKDLMDTYKRSDICIVAKEHRLLESIQQGLKDHQVPCEMLNQNEPDFDSDQVKIVTMHSIKGLEFKVIILVHLDEGVIPSSKIYDRDDMAQIESEDRKLLYVGMTRANELLYMTSVHKPSKFIQEIDPSQLRLKRDCGLRPFQSIGIQNYQLIHQVLDLNAKEEVIRQWMIRELYERYGYPLELMTLEYPVQQFSKRGYVDVAVHIFFQNNKKPYLFIETKRFGSGVDQGLEQLKSYMQADEAVLYGVVTDGLSVVVIDRGGEVLQDIPKCQPTFLQDKREHSIYQSIKQNKQYNYSYEKEDPENIEIRAIDNNMLIEQKDTSWVPIVGHVAAGLPVLVNQDYEASLMLPTQWLIDPDQTFALKVSGDSMKDMGICPGYHVIVNKQNYANNGDVVIAVIDQEATMKRFMKMGDTVLLLAENPSYEAIQMKQEDVLINGKVIGFFR